MYLVAIAWMYVALMMAVAEATHVQGSVLGALVTFLLYGLGPVTLVLYLLGTPARRAARRAAEAAEAAEAARHAPPPADAPTPQAAASSPPVAASSPPAASSSPQAAASSPPADGPPRA